MDEDTQAAGTGQRYGLWHYVTAGWVLLGLVGWIGLWPRWDGHTSADTAAAWAALGLGLFAACVTGLGAAILSELRRIGR